MKKFKTKQEVVDRYWPDFLMYCIRDREAYRQHPNPYVGWTTPTIDNFWVWYMTDGPLGVKHRHLFYTKEDVDYC